MESRKARQTSGPNASVVASASPATVAAGAAKARQRPVAISTSGIISPNCGL